MKRVVIAGTGLIGASFGLALRQAGFDGEIVGVSSPCALTDALAAGAIDRGAPLEQAVRGAGLVFLSQTISRILVTLRDLDGLLDPGTLVTDAGSTKSEIVATARRHFSRARFLGGHPMAGKEVRGAAGADGQLFRNRVWALTPSDPGDLELPPVVEFRAWLDRFGARVVILDPDEHDRAAALTSHLAQLASTALAATLAERLGPPPACELAGPGLLDMSRLALSSFDIWGDILATNTVQIDRALSSYIAALERLRADLGSPRAESAFARAQQFAAKLREL
jgi:prephenate dehydrogenase